MSVDGGVGDDTIVACAEAGANLFVAGTAIFKGDIEQRFKQLNNKLNQNC
ncbi:MAG: hypothetical protein LBH59_04690 [Planctomycetaceae bacterium]|nr:hypothetical protein [Planctomycetaceae bacterium]